MLFIAAHDDDWIEGKGYKKQILSTGANLHQPGALIQRIVIAPKTEVALHYHKKTTEAFYILKGEGVMTISGNTFNLKPGDLLTCEPGEKHDAKNPYDISFEYIVFKTNVVENDLYWD